MFLKEAIEILSHLSTAGAPNITLDEIDAVKLGIEALKECVKARQGDPALDGELLPGETDE